MGARVSFQPRTVTLTRRELLHGADYTLRLPSVGATETLVLAALGTDGETTIIDAGHIARGYPDLAGMLRRLGAGVRTRTEQSTKT